jgi:hypothetical protein
LASCQAHGSLARARNGRASPAFPHEARGVYDVQWTDADLIATVAVSITDVALVEYWSFDASGAEWRELPRDNALPELGLRPSAWTGEEVVWWGGEGDYVEPAGKRYHPGTDEWSDLSDRGAPAPRNDHTITPTGRNAPDRDVIVWGGTHDEGGVGTGGRPRPGPPPLLGESLTWTRNSLVIWGGVPECSLDDDATDCDESERVWMLDEQALFGALPEDEEGCECRSRTGVEVSK